MATEKKFSIKVEIEKSIESVNKFKDSLANIPGPIGGVVQGLGGLTTAARAFIATPIGAIVAALGAVFMALKKGIESSEKATMGLNKIMGAFNGIIGPIIKSIGLLAEKLIDGVVWAMEKVMDAAEALGLEFAENAKAGMKLAESLNQIEEAEGDLEVARAQQNKTLAEAREILSDTNATYAERKKALDEVRKSEEALAQREVELAKQRVAAAKENIRLNGASAAANDQLDQALIKLANTEQDLAAKRRLFNKEEKKLIAETEAKAKEAAAAADARRKEQLAKEIEYQQNRKKAQEGTLKLLRDAEIESIADGRRRETAALKAKLEDDIKAAADEIKNKKDLEDRKKALIEIANNDLLKINQKYNDLQEEQNTQANRALMEDYEAAADTEKEAVQKKYDDIIATVEKNYALQQFKTVLFQEKTLKDGKKYIETVTTMELDSQSRKDKLIESLEKERDAKKKEIDQKQLKEETLREVEKLDKIYAAQKAADTRALANLDKNAKDYEQKKEEIEKRQRDREIGYLQQRILTLKEGQEATADELVAAQQEYYDKVNELREEDLQKEKEAAEQRKQFALDTIKAVLDVAQQITNAYQSFLDYTYQKGYEKEKEAFNNRKAELDKRYEEDLAAVEGNEAAKAAIQTKYENDLAQAEYQRALANWNLQKDQFEKGKRVQIANAIITGIQGAMNAYISLASIPYVGPILGAIAAAAAATTAAFQVATIKKTTFDQAQPTPPAGSGSGGPSKFAKGGLLMGRKHAEGGVMTSFGELEGGEYVINREATSSFLPLLDKINSMGSGSGAPNNLSSQAEMGMGGGTPIIKTYVVASEVSSQQEADKKISDIARL